MQPSEGPPRGYAHDTRKFRWGLDRACTFHWRGSGRFHRYPTACVSVRPNDHTHPFSLGHLAGNQPSRFSIGDCRGAPGDHLLSPDGIRLVMTCPGRMRKAKSPARTSPLSLDFTAAYGSERGSSVGLPCPLILSSDSCYLCVEDSWPINLGLKTGEIER